MAKEKEQSVDRIKLIEAQMKALGIHKTALVRGEQFKAATFTPTGIDPIDKILGDGGGIPDGTLAEFCGDSQTGKTHVALSTIAKKQEMGRRCAFLNVENSFYEPRASSLGVQVRNPDLFELYQDIDTAEKWGDLLCYLVETGDYGVIVVDSITALMPKVEYDKSLGDAPKFGVHATYVGRLAKKLLGLCASTGTIVILINQFRTGAGAVQNTYVKTPTGGKGMEFFTHMRLWFAKVGGADGKMIGAGGDVIGGKSRITVVKTRYGTPNVFTVFPIYFKDEEVNPIGEFLYVSQARGKEYVKVKYKKYQYLVQDTGELLENKDAVEFIKMMMSAPAPLKLKKGDNGENAFLYVCSRLKYDEDRINAILVALENTDSTKIIVPESFSEMQLAEDSEFGDED